MTEQTLNLAVWSNWYPDLRPDFSRIEPGQSAYGQPNEETLAIFRTIGPKLNIVDFGGGDGRYAIPLTQMGHNVLLTDIDQAHLNRLRFNYSSQSNKQGRIVPVYMDALKKFDIPENSADAVLNTGLGYLMPPDKLKIFMKNLTHILKPTGSMVFEFATNRERKDENGNSTFGDKEHQYTSQEGIAILEEQFELNGITLRELKFKRIELNKPYYLRTDLIIAHGIKK